MAEDEARVGGRGGCPGPLGAPTQADATLRTCLPCHIAAFALHKPPPSKPEGRGPHLRMHLTPRGLRDTGAWVWAAGPSGPPASRPVSTWAFPALSSMSPNSPATSGDTALALDLSSLLLTKGSHLSPPDSLSPSRHRTAGPHTSPQPLAASIQADPDIGRPGCQAVCFCNQFCI